MRGRKLRQIVPFLNFCKIYEGIFHTSGFFKLSQVPTRDILLAAAAQQGGALGIEK